MPILVNDIANLPHHEQENVRVKINQGHGAYGVFGFV
jgi:hypothetical protein